MNPTIPGRVGGVSVFTAHGTDYRVCRVNHNSYSLRKLPMTPGQRVRWGDRRQIADDVAHVQEVGCLPPAGRSFA